MLWTMEVISTMSARDEAQGEGYILKETAHHRSQKQQA